jgi:phosphoribosylformimino-5-aminoimidazole carboxamide ribotide isomerase
MNRLALWPSIDLRGGAVVRLLHGDPSKETRYDGRPEEVARRFEAEGGDGLHVVDLDAAFGTGDNRDVIRRILGAVSMPVQVGGGIRGLSQVEGLFDAGAWRVVVGSLPFSDPAAFRVLLGELGERLVVALDCKDGRPTIRGWTESAGSRSVDTVAADLGRLGVAALLVTDVARDGAMTGPNLEMLADIRRVFPGEVLASGGMRGEEDLSPVADALAGGPCGAIFGRALHGGTTTVARLRAALEPEAEP